MAFILLWWFSLTGWSGLTETSRSIFKHARVQFKHYTEKKCKFRLKRKWNASVQLEIFLSQKSKLLFQQLHNCSLHTKNILNPVHAGSKVQRSHKKATLLKVKCD